jgi:hypothetical protein
MITTGRDADIVYTITKDGGATFQPAVLLLGNASGSER